MQMSRRAFLITIPAGAALVHADDARGQSARPAAGPRIGCQTNAWPIKAGDFDQFLGVLRTLKSLGFDGFETTFRNVQSQYPNAAAARRSRSSRSASRASASTSSSTSTTRSPASPRWTS